MIRPPCSVPAAVARVLMTSPPPQAAALVVRNVRIVHGDGRVTPRATRDRAPRADRRHQPPATSGAARRPGRDVDGAGRTLIPGLIDAHVHVTDWSLPLLLRHGVTTVRDLHNAPGLHSAARARRRAGPPADRRGRRAARRARQLLEGRRASSARWPTRAPPCAIRLRPARR